MLGRRDISDADAGKSPRHSHKFDIADDSAVHVLVDKLLSMDKSKSNGQRKERKEKLMHALDEAAQHYHDSNEKTRQAFFHGLLTGYAVALKLR